LDPEPAQREGLVGVGQRVEIKMERQELEGVIKEEEGAERERDLPGTSQTLENV
jgi:hypothetical protein